MRGDSSSDTGPVRDLRRRHLPTGRQTSWRTLFQPARHVKPQCGMLAQRLSQSPTSHEPRVTSNERARAATSVGNLSAAGAAWFADRETESTNSARSGSRFAVLRSFRRPRTVGRRVGFSARPHDQAGCRRLCTPRPCPLRQAAQGLHKARRENRVSVPYPGAVRPSSTDSTRPTLPAGICDRWRAPRRIARRRDPSLSAIASRAMLPPSAAACRST